MLMRMPRVLINECKQEISSFNPFLGRYHDFAISTGADLLAAHKGVGSEVGGALQVFAENPEIEVVPGFSARAITSGGTVADEDFARIAEGFLDAVRAHRDVDAIYFSLHGAMAAQTEHDVEGYLLEQTRQIVGESIPIVTSLDLHGILTDRILAHSNAVVLYHTYPHIDFFETGQRSARLLLRIIRGDVRPVSARVAIPALVRGPQLRTETGMWGQCVRRAIAIENGPRGLSGGMFIGNPFTDVPDLCSNVLLVTDDDEQLAVTEAVSIAQQFWGMREHLYQPLTPLDECIALAAKGTGYTVLVDAADATSSGASGDSSAILAAMLDARYSRTVLMPFVDPPAVQAAFAAGVGATVDITLGGQLDPRFARVPLTCKVRLLSDGLFRNESHGSTWDGGPSALLESANYTFTVTSKAVSLYDRSLFYSMGQFPETFDTVIVKSPHCQPHMFLEPAACYLDVDAPGSTSANLHSLGHTRCRRPIFPLDDNVTFTPQAKIFRRGA
jgi:microcystin degradation protein MlrC